MNAIAFGAAAMLMVSAASAFAFVPFCAPSGLTKSPGRPLVAEHQHSQQSGGRPSRWSGLRMSDDGMDYPSDTGVGEAYEPPREQSAEAKMELTKLKVELLRLAAATDRGQLMNTESGAADKELVNDILYSMESLSPIHETAGSFELKGKWLLVYSSDDITRSSPFFWTWRKVSESLNTATATDAIFALTDNIPVKHIGRAMQTIDEDTLVNEVEIFAGSKGGKLSLGSKMTTTSEAWPKGMQETELKATKTQVVDSSIGKLLAPIFSVDDLAFPTDTFFEAVGRLKGIGGGAVGGIAAAAAAAAAAARGRRR